MEAAFYEDGRSYVQPSTNKEEVRKRLTLDLNSPRLKKPRFDVLLSSPDLNMLKLPSPELEKLIMQQNGLLSATPTPNGFVYPLPTPNAGNTNTASGNSSNSRPVRDPDPYGRGLDVALAALTQQQAAANQLQSGGVPHQNSLLESSNSSSNSQAGPYIGHPPSSSSPFPNTIQMPAVKEEPRCNTSLSSTPPMSPIDMEDQERIKLERKRQRNRIAASKCRRRKLERIARLEDKVKLLKNDNSELAMVVVKLRQQVCNLKEQVMEHINCGCQIMLTNQF